MHQATVAATVASEPLSPAASLRSAVNAAESFSGGVLVVGPAPVVVAVELLARNARHSPITAWKFPGPSVGRFKGFAAFGLPLLGFVALALLLGFYVATAAYLAGVMRFQGRYRIASCIAVGVGTSAFFFVVLEVWFKVPLLKGPLEAFVRLH